jgi:hypothetical protein
MSPRLLSLNCPNCGANLQFNPDLPQFACSYCGASVAVHKEGGTVSLSRIAESVQRLESQTSRVAAELALARYEKEITELESRLASAEKPHHTRTGLGCASAFILIAIAGSQFTAQPVIAFVLAAASIAVAVYIYATANPPEHAAIHKQLISLRMKAAQQRRLVDSPPLGPDK